MEPLTYEQRGYLQEDFRLFHLADDTCGEIGYHYHTFHKVIVLLAGRAGYAVEGVHYQLEPGDMVLVTRGSVHRPEIAHGDFYERMILYIAPEYLSSLGKEDLGTCFARVEESFACVYRTDEETRTLLRRLESTGGEQGFGSDILRRAVFSQLMVALNRTVLAGDGRGGAGDGKMHALLQYLNGHLADELTIDELSRRFYMSKYHMMRRFREETGYTIHSYVTEKRLLHARELLRSGLPLWETAERCGYLDYSTFSRAYKKKFGHAPSLTEK